MARPKTSSHDMIIGIIAIIIILYVLYHLFYGTIYRKFRTFGTSETLQRQRWYIPLEGLKRRIT